MTATCTFDGTTVQTQEITRLLLHGNYAFECTVVCRTTTYTNYTAIAAKAGTTKTPGVCALKTITEAGYVSVQSEGGTKGTLVLNGATHTNCYIETISAAEVPKSQLGVWEFTVAFVRETVT